MNVNLQFPLIREWTESCAKNLTTKDCLECHFGLGEFLVANSFKDRLECSERAPPTFRFYDQAGNLVEDKRGEISIPMACKPLLDEMMQMNKSFSSSEDTFSRLQATRIDLRKALDKKWCLAREQLITVLTMLLPRSE